MDQGLLVLGIFVSVLMALASFVYLWRFIISLREPHQKVYVPQDVTRHALWLKQGDREVLDFPLVTVKAEMFPDFSGYVVFFAEGFTLYDERGIVEQRGYAELLKSPLIVGDSEEDIKGLLQAYINSHTAMAIDLMLGRYE